MRRLGAAGECSFRLLSAAFVVFILFSCLFINPTAGTDADNADSKAAEAGEKLASESSVPASSEDSPKHQDATESKDTVPPADQPQNPLARGWGNDINWVTMTDALRIAREESKPIMLLIHKSWCGACQALKPLFSKAKELKKLSAHFVMVNWEDDEEPGDEQYKPDGAYIPRILFLKPNGSVMKDVKNPNQEYNSYNYYYSNPAPILKSMKNVMVRFGFLSKDEL
jgi:protein-disulfide reductase (glutathione)